MNKQDYQLLIDLIQREQIGAEQYQYKADKALKEAAANGSLNTMNKKTAQVQAAEERKNQCMKILLHLRNEQNRAPAPGELKLDQDGDGEEGTFKIDQY